MPGTLQCKVCGKMVYVEVQADGNYPRGAYQCPNNCKLPKPIDITLHIGSNDRLAIRKLQRMAEINWQTYADLDSFRKVFAKLNAGEV